jgi:hypothetical protein
MVLNLALSFWLKESKTLLMGTPQLAKPSAANKKQWTTPSAIRVEVGGVLFWKAVKTVLESGGFSSFIVTIYAMRKEDGDR